MGKSNSIEEQQKANKQFQEYTDAMNKDMEQQLEKTKASLDGMAKEHYEAFPDKAMLMEGRYSHLSTMSEWSLASVSKLIDECRNAIFGGRTPKGTEKEEVGQDVSLAIQAIKSRELFIANAAFDIVQSLVGSFNNSTSTSVETKLDAKPLSPGLTLFIGVMNNAYSHASFFRNEKIVQNMFIFRVFYSIKEGKAQSRLSDLEAYENQKIAFRNNLKKLNDTVAAMDIMSDTYIEDLTKYTSLADLVNDRLKALDARIAELALEKGERNDLEARLDMAESEECNFLVSMLRSRWRAAYKAWKETV